MKKLFQKMTVYFLILTIGLIGSIAGSLSGAEAATTPSIGFINTSSSGSERISNQKFGVILSGKATSDVTVDFKIDTISSTAVAGVDYKPYNGTVYIKAGELTRTVPLIIYDDLVGGPSKTVVIKLSNPNNATLGVNDTYTFTVLEDNMPLTSLVSNPSTPNGENGWYITAPQVTLTRDRAGWTYYQWNTHDQGKWINYKASITVPEGANTLYYYSKDARDVNGGVKEEPLKSKTFKVDTTRPGTPLITTDITAAGYVKLSWSKINDAVYYKVYRAGSDFGLIAASSSESYLDNAVTRGVSYRYKVIAIDKAGNQSYGNITTVLVPKIEVVTNNTNTTTSSTSSIVTQAVKAQKVFKSIGTGIATSTENATVTPAVEGLSTSNGDKVGNSEPENSRDWNKILLTIAILIILAGAAIGGFYGYEWWLTRKKSPFKEEKKNSKSRW